MIDCHVPAERQLKLFHKYPELFEYALDSRTDKNMHPITLYHIECWNGWMNIIEKMSSEIAAIDTNKVIKVLQIKQKFAGLRYYYTWTEDKPDYLDNISKITSDYETLSFETCEVCGNPGSRATNHGYILTLCRNCMKTEDFKDYRRPKNKNA